MISKVRMLSWGLRTCRLVWKVEAKWFDGRPVRRQLIFLARRTWAASPPAVAGMC